MIVEVPHIDLPKAGGMKGRPITTEEFERILEKVPSVVGKRQAESWRYLISGLWWSGLRLGEALKPHWTDDRDIVVHFTGRRPMLFFRAHAHKSGKDCVLPMAPEFAEFLLATPADERTGYVFDPQPQRSYGGRLRLDTTSKIISRIGKKAGVKVADADKGPKYASAHNLRRSFGERRSKRVMPTVLQELMRHSGIETTMEFYVGRNAQATADAACDAYGNTASNTSGNTHLNPTADNPENAAISVPPQGIEPSADCKGKTPLSETGGAKCGARDAQNGVIDADLARIIAAWPTLPADVKQAVLGLVESAANSDE